MTYPRLLNEGTAEEQRLLRTALEDRPSPHTQAQVFARLGLGLSPAVTASPATTPTSNALSQAAPGSLSASLVPGVTPLISWAKWVGIATVALGIGFGATAAAKHFVARKDARSFVAPTRSLPQLEDRTDSASMHANRNEPHPTSDARPAHPLGAEAVTTLPLPSSKTPIAKTQASANDDSDRSGLEVRLIDAARTALNAGNAAVCLVKLDERSRRIKRGMLEPESALLRVQALLALGQRSAAERTAARFLSHQPNGPLSDRIRYTLLPATGEK